MKKSTTNLLLASGGAIILYISLLKGFYLLGQITDQQEVIKLKIQFLIMLGTVGLTLCVFFLEQTLKK